MNNILDMVTRVERNVAPKKLATLVNQHDYRSAPQGSLISISGTAASPDRAFQR